MSDDDRMDALVRQIAAEDYNRPPEIVPREAMWEAVQIGLKVGTAGTGKDNVLPFTRRIPKWVFLAVAAVLLLAVGIQVGRYMGPARTAPLAVVPNVTAQDSLGSAAAPDSTAPQRDVIQSGPSRAELARVEPETRRASDDRGGPPRPGPEPERVDPSATDNGVSSAYRVATAQHLTAAEAMLTAFKSDLSQGRMDAQMASWGKDLLANTRLLLDSPAAKDPVRRKLLQDLELVLVQIVQLSPNAPQRDRDLIKDALTEDQVLTRLRTALPPDKGT